MTNLWRQFWTTSRWRSPLATVIAFIFVAISVVIAVALDRRGSYNKDWTAFRAVEFGQTLAPGQTGVAVYGVRPFVDFMAQTTTITWMPYACGSLNVEQAGCSRRFTRAVDFWIDTPENATFTLNPARIPRDTQDKNNYLQLQPAWTFPYQHLFRAGTWDGHLDLTYYYPGDSLNCTTVWRATDTVTGAEIPVLKLDIVESPTGYFPNAWDYDVFVNVTDTSPGVIARLVQFTFFRSGTVKAFTVMIVIVNWGLTIIVLHITLHYVIEGSRIEVPREILLLPVSVILTVPQLRMAMPDVPRFGIMLGLLSVRLLSLLSLNFTDLIGYFFNIIIIAICSFVLILLLIYPRMKSPPPTPIPASPRYGIRPELRPEPFSYPSTSTEPKYGRRHGRQETTLVDDGALFKQA